MAARSRLLSLQIELQDQIWDEVIADTVYAKEHYNPLSFPIECPSGMYAWFGTWLKPDSSFALAPDGSHQTKSTLKKLLHTRGLKPSGNKSQLISRLQEHDKEQPKEVFDTPEKRGYVRLFDGDKARLCGSRTKKPIFLNWDWYKTAWAKLLNTCFPLRLRTLKWLRKWIERLKTLNPQWYKNIRGEHMQEVLGGLIEEVDARSKE